ncbi:Panacea domain-containing protein [Nocardia sp. BMG51109]|uniref:Panacea domain-containing protein n=1 Tax=Nocardia sp. BMG51109 TaxID=1056816 RepID=UPI0004661E1B|nr:type II toxin-antitoxin system antitoxin SocA domain-containing protein [Nocardia sp. BMG51109]
MVTALDVAGYVYRQRGWVDAWKLEKLIYFAQAWHLTWDGRPLFEDKFEAWLDGPVQPTVYRVNKYDRPSPWSTQLPGADPDALPGATKAIVDAVLEHYAHLDKPTLVELSHELPWQRARGDVPADAKCTAELSESDIKRWYTAKVLRGEKDIPDQPHIQPVGVAEVGYEVAVDVEISRWEETLRLLAER